MWVYNSWGEQRSWVMTRPILLWNCCLFCCLSVSQFSPHWPSNYLCLVASSFLLFTQSGYFLLLLLSLSNDLGSAMHCLHCGAGVSSLSHHIQVFVGLSLSMNLWDRVLLCTVFFIRRMKKQSHCSASHSPGCAEPSLRGLMPFPPDVGEAGKQEFFPCVICVQLRHCSQAGLGWVLGLKLCHPHFSGMQGPESHLTTQQLFQQWGLSQQAAPSSSHQLLSYSPGSWTHVFILLVEYTCNLNIVW